MEPRLSAADPRALLRELEQRARKKYGQHFLARPDVVARIVRLSGVRPGDRVVEIGPGLGVLTEQLVAAGADVTAVEVDGELLEHLGTYVPAARLVHADATTLDWAALFPEGGVKLVANLPYNVGTGLVMDAARRPEVFASATVMLQAEVVARMVAEPGADAFGALSVELGVRGVATALFDVPPSAFVPPPKVVSTVMRVDIARTPDVGPAGPDAFDRCVRSCFAMRRKTLRNNLVAAYGREAAEAALQAAGLDPNLRAETVGPEGFRALAAALARTATRPRPA